jgi:hypothetical protein
MATFLIVAGALSLAYGLSTLLGRTKNWAEDSALDKKLFSKNTRNSLSRYYAGLQFVGAGLGAIALGLILYFSK